MPDLLMPDLLIPDVLIPDRLMPDRLMPDRPPKKIEKFLNTPLRISADCDIMCGVDSARGRNGHRPLNCGNASPYGARGQLGNTTR